MILEIMLDFEDFEDVLDVDDFEDDVGLSWL